MATLRMLRGPNPGQTLAVQGDSAVLGRHPDCDIVLQSASVSRQHAKISKLGGNYYVEDLNSRNGTLLNDLPVNGRQPLADNDQLTLCDEVFVFHVGAASGHRSDNALRGEGQATAIMVDDVPQEDNATIMSRVDVSTGVSSLQFGINPEAKLQALVEIGKNLGNALGTDQVLPKLLDSLFTIFPQADRGFVVMKSPSDGQLIPKAVKFRRQQHEGTLRISRTIVDGVVESKQAILSADAAADSRFDMAESIVDFQIRSMMCAPLINSKGQALGVIQIDTLDQRSRFSREDLDVLASVACQAAFSVENAQLHEMAVREQALKRELAVAHEVQRRFLPTVEPDIEGYDFFQFYEPASQLGGDYYDYIAMPDGRLGVVVADVSGKGISASLLMARLSAETRFYLATEPTPAEAVGRLNRVFCGNNWEDRFVTLALCVLDPAQNEVTIVNAGHMPPLLRTGPGKVEALAEEETSLPIGVVEDIKYGQCTLPLALGQCVAMYTDGITEAMNDADDLYGLPRLWDQLRSNVEGVDRIGQAILDDVKHFVGNHAQSDDMCLACFGRDRR
ncbi:MAG: SpoIIE family protein phosphatase [Thermoguttaceae bacterium]